MDLDRIFWWAAFICLVILAVCMAVVISVNWS